MVAAPPQVVSQILHLIEIAKEGRVRIRRTAIDHLSRDHDAEFHDDAPLSVLKRNDKLGASLRIGFGDRLANPLASPGNNRDLSLQSLLGATRHMSPLC